MSLQAELTVLNSDESTKVKIRAVLSTEDIHILEAFLDCTDRLLEVKTAREGVPCSFEMRVENDQVKYITSESPSDEELAALLHRLRPFILVKELVSYLKVSSRLSKLFNHTYVRNLLKEQRELFDGRSNQRLVRITSNDVLINCEKTLFDWLNGFEYHQDPAKRARIESLHRVMPFEHSKPVLLTLLGNKVQAILELASLIAVILGRQDKVQVKRRGA